MLSEKGKKKRRRGQAYLMESSQPVTILPDRIITAIAAHGLYKQSPLFVRVKKTFLHRVIMTESLS